MEQTQLVGPPQSAKSHSSVSNVVFANHVKQQHLHHHSLPSAGGCFALPTSGWGKITCINSSYLQTNVFTAAGCGGSPIVGPITQITPATCSLAPGVPAYYENVTCQSGNLTVPTPTTGYTQADSYTAGCSGQLSSGVYVPRESPPHTHVH